MKKKNLIVLSGVSMLAIVLMLTLSFIGNRQDIREHAAGPRDLPDHAWRNPHDMQQSQTMQAQLTITLPPENMRYKAPNDISAPTLSLSGLTNGTVVQRGSIIPLTVTASDNIAVSQVVFLVNGNVICTLSTTPYTCSWTVPVQPAGTFLIVVRASDQTGNLTSKSVVVHSR